ncbi:RabGAP/TBC [Saitoella complicata NRRL Y-17804]|uniref:GTPase-activating protein GYP5 n=1 Tax=Saitoella complicata (strain BCRC 22490 / CBS 7301 / JCM 7358 / NBRC 10748 / NRRL Y-17804) TaxID=698492 RepID=A0A0E9N8Q6_SAICN|nr:RabGAP/TBC [Saitoella complicata NRRL Y-17804]ODQ55765.1 RabGAP/TBC [Saitoella complicata NRRL Y-17804]GAO46183.1 hypothetical protein G7K_0420-t1 [Saitoella complicata NRRL Y-17804]
MSEQDFADQAFTSEERPGLASPVNVPDEPEVKESVEHQLETHEVEHDAAEFLDANRQSPEAEREARELAEEALAAIEHSKAALSELHAAANDHENNGERPEEKGESAMKEDGEHAEAQQQHATDHMQTLDAQSPSEEIDRFHTPVGAQPTPSEEKPEPEPLTDAMHDISLSDNEATHTPTAMPTSPTGPPLPPRDSHPTAQRMKSDPAPPTPARRGPFSWLRSASTGTALAGKKSPPVSPPLEAAGKRRDTMASVDSVSTIAPTAELLLPRVRQPQGEGDADGVDGLVKESLKANFDRLHSQSQSQVSEDEAHTIPEESVDWDFWDAVINDYPSVQRDRPQDLSRAIQNGLPSIIRGTIWTLLANSKSPSLEAQHQKLCGLPGLAANEKQIRKDLSRTYPKADFFRSGSTKEGQERLFYVVKAYSLHDPEVGYVQGESFIAGPLLMNLPDEEAFSLLVRLMHDYGLRTLYTPSMPGLHSLLYQFDRLLEVHCPLLHVHLARQGVESGMYASQWFLTLFAYKFPLPIVLRIFDVIIAEGTAALLRFALALMKKNEERFLSMEFDTLVGFLKEGLFDAYKVQEQTRGYMAWGSGGEAVYRVNELVNDAYTIKITSEELESYKKDYEDATSAERKREAEVEDLRTANAQLSALVKRLETTLSSLNREHIELANAMVQSKVENARLTEENEDLHTTVSELRNALSTQPAEIEEKLRKEMDTVMQKNLDVMNQNQEVESRCAELEGELSNVKVQYAEVSSKYEALNRRWQELRRALDEEPGRTR